jgi:hypothetical protein
MKKAYRIGFKSLVRENEKAYILNRSYDLKSFAQFKHRRISRILILIQGEK